MHFTVENKKQRNVIREILSPLPHLPIIGNIRHTCSAGTLELQGVMYRRSTAITSRGDTGFFFRNRSSVWLCMSYKATKGFDAIGAVVGLPA